MQLDGIALQDGIEENNSGTGDEPPPEVLDMGFCWPALVFGWWFCAANNIPPRLSADWILLGFVALGPNGYREAWRHRRFESLATFQRCMGRWNLAAKLTVALTAVAIITALIFHGH